MGLHGKISLPQSVNWSKTKAFTTIRPTGEGVSINLAGRQPTCAASATSSSRPPARGRPTSILVSSDFGESEIIRCVTPWCYPPEGMDAAVWTAIAVLAATSLGTLFYLGARIDGLAGRMDDRFGQMDARFEALIARMDSRFDRVDARFDHMEDRFDALAARLDAHLDRHAS